MNNDNKNLQINVPYDVSNFKFSNTEKVVLDYINGLGDFKYLCNPFPSGEKSLVVSANNKFFITYNFYNNYSAKKNRDKLTSNTINPLKVVQLELQFKNNYSIGSIAIDGRDITIGMFPPNILMDKLEPQLKRIKLNDVEADSWKSLKDNVKMENFDISSLGAKSFDEIVQKNLVNEFAFKLKKLISDKVNYFKKLKLDWCSLNGIPQSDLIIYMSRDILDTLALNNMLIYNNNENLSKSSEDLFTTINGVKIIPSTNHKDYLGIDILFATNWCCASVVADVNARVYLKEGTAKDYLLDAEFFAQGACKFYDVSKTPADKISPVLFGETIVFAK